MGYDTEFEGALRVEPPLDAEEVAFLRRFARSRRMKRKGGPYINSSDERDVLDFNTPPEGQPGLWCDWEPSDDGSTIEWNHAEKSYDSTEWIKYLIEHFLKPGALAIGQVAAIKGGHVVNGEVVAQGEDMRDRWRIVVVANKVYVRRSTRKGL